MQPRSQSCAVGTHGRCSNLALKLLVRKLARSADVKHFST